MIEEFDVQVNIERDETYTLCMFMIRPSLEMEMAEQLYAEMLEWA